MTIHCLLNLATNVEYSDFSFIAFFLYVYRESKDVLCLADNDFVRFRCANVINFFSVLLNLKKPKKGENIEVSHFEMYFSYFIDVKLCSMINIYLA